MLDDRGRALLVDVAGGTLQGSPASALGTCSYSVPLLVVAGMGAKLSLKDLAELLVERGLAGRRCVLEADTAARIGLNLRVAAERPTRDDLIAIICGRLCNDGRCQPCMAKANVIHAAFNEDRSPIRRDPAYGRYRAKFGKLED